jgi:hypothetical protein
VFVASSRVNTTALSPGLKPATLPIQTFGKRWLAPRVQLMQAPDMGAPSTCVLMLGRRTILRGRRTPGRRNACRHGPKQRSVDGSHLSHWDPCMHKVASSCKGKYKRKQQESAVAYKLQLQVSVLLDMAHVARVMWTLLQACSRCMQLQACKAEPPP